MKRIGKKNQSGKSLVDYTIGVLGTASIYWLDVIETINSLAAFIAAVGGAILVIIRVAIAWREWRAGKCKNQDH